MLGGPDVRSLIHASSVPWQQSFSFIFFLKILYLKGRIFKKDWEIDLFPKWLKAGAKLKLGARICFWVFHLGGTCLCNLTICCCLPKALAGSWIRSGTARAQTSSLIKMPVLQQVAYPLCHNANLLATFLRAHALCGWSPKVSSGPVSPFCDIPGGSDCCWSLWLRQVLSSFSGS